MPLVRFRMAGTETETLKDSEVTDRHYKHRDKAEIFTYPGSLVEICKYIKRACK